MTFSVIFAYVADITEEQERSTAYGLVTLASATGSLLRTLDPGIYADLAAVSSGFGHICGQSGDQSGHRRLPVGPVRRQPGCPRRHGDFSSGHRLRVLRRPGVAAGKDEADVVGLPHLLGTG